MSYQTHGYAVPFAPLQEPDPKTFDEMKVNDKIFQLQHYLSTLAQIQSLGVEMKAEINAVTRKLNEIMDVNVLTLKK